MYKLARSQHMKPPRKPEIGEVINWSKPWKETHDLMEALKLQEFSNAAPRIIQKREVIINFKRNIARLRKLKMKVLFMEDENEVDNIYSLINEIDLLNDASGDEIDKIIQMDKSDKNEIDNENGNENENEDENENENGNENENESGENDIDIEMGNNEQSPELLTPSYISNDQIQSQMSQSQTQNSVVSGAAIIPFAKKSKSSQSQSNSSRSQSQLQLKSSQV